MQDKLRILKNLEGVNQDAFAASVEKHYASIELMEVDELIQDISICDEYGIRNVKESGIVDFALLTRTNEEMLAYAQKNNNMISVEEYSSGRSVA